MKMEALPSSIAYCDDYDKDLVNLLDAFGSVVSLEDIASAYCQGGRNVCTAAEILSNLQGSTSSTSTSISKDKFEGASSSLGWSSDPALQKSNVERNSMSSKTKKCSVSVGTVSGVIGKDYFRHRPLTNGCDKVTKPLKLNSEELPFSQLWDEKITPDVGARSETMPSEVEEFLFTMLGDGFQLDMNVIREVLGSCGYDVKKGMEKLLDLPTSTLEKRGDFFGRASQKRTNKCSDMESLLCQEVSHSIDSAPSDKARFISKNKLESPKRDKCRNDLQKEILEALFNVPERFEEPKRTRPVNQVRRSRAFGEAVVEPLRDTVVEHRTAPAKPQVNEDEDEEDENSYEFLRKAVKEYLFTMKEYYKSAADEFGKGNHVQAYKLLDEGHFFMRKAREADEKSAQKLLETRDDKEGMTLDLCYHEPKEAIRLLKIHLTSLSGIPSILNLKLIVGTNDSDTKEGARKRLIKKLLEKESITWTEEANGQFIVVPVGKINPKHLAFAKKM